MLTGFWIRNSGARNSTQVSAPAHYRSTEEISRDHASTSPASRRTEAPVWGACGHSPLCVELALSPGLGTAGRCFANSSPCQPASVPSTSTFACSPIWICPKSTSGLDRLTRVMADCLSKTCPSTRTSFSSSPCFSFCLH